VSLTPFRRHRRTWCWLAACCASTSAMAGGGASGCSDFSAIAPFTQIRYTQIQAIFDAPDPQNPEQALCTSCHPGSSGPAGLGLGDGFSYENLVNVPTGQPPPPPAPEILRVAPGDPLGSLLFQKLNCDVPELGARMPLGGNAISLTQQAFFYDWIRLGAPLSRLGFEDR
jgi:hypothetical protein